MMKRIRTIKLPSFLGLAMPGLVMLTGMWLALGLHISAEIEQQFRSLISHQAEDTGNPVYPELIEYQNSLFNSYALFRLNARDHQLADVLAGLVFRTELEYGPVIFGQKQIHTAFARMKIRIDKGLSSEESNAWLSRLFGAQEPLQLAVVIDSRKKYHYEINTAALEYQVADIKLAIATGKAKGSFGNAAKLPPIVLSFTDFSLRQGDVTVSSIDNLLQLDSLSNLDGKITLPSVEIESGMLKPPILAGSSIKFSSQGPDALITGIRSHLTTRDEQGQISNSSLLLNLANIQLDTVFQLFKQYEEQHHLQQQIEWTLEAAADSQEGQDRLVALFQQQEETVLPRAEDMISKLFTGERTNANFLFGMENQRRDSQIRAEFAYNGLQPVVPDRP